MDEERRKRYRPLGHNRWDRRRPEWWNRLQELWTKAVDAPGYNKQQWQDFAECLEREMPVKGGQYV